MNAEISFFGVFTPSLLLCAVVAYLVSAGIKEALAAIGFYRFVWHRSLFNFAMFICLLGVAELLLSEASL